MTIEPRYSTEGRLARSWRLSTASWASLRRHPRLFVLPAFSAVLTIIAAAVIFLPVAWLTRDLDFKLTLFIASVASALPFTLIATAFNVGFLSMVLAYERGEHPTVRDGLRTVGERLPHVIGWSLLSAVVGVLISGLQRLPGGEWVENLIGFLGGLAWALATYFVVPILVLDRVGPIESVRRSARTFRERWGETISADIGIGFIFGLLSVPGLLFICAGAGVLESEGLVAGGVLIALGFALFTPPTVASVALTELFALELYRYSAGGQLSGPFTENDVATALERRKPPWWKR